MNEFKKLGLDEHVIKTVEKLGYKTPTEIQEKTIPLVIKGEDIIAQSATGTGKTFAFLAGVLGKLDVTKGAQAIVITPTRELAIQIDKETKKFTKNTHIKSCVVYGGDPIRFQTSEIKKAHIVIATPGRLLDHIERGNLNLKKVKHVILDEADRMSDMGFIIDIKKILEYMPKEKQMLLFSATITKDVKNIENKFMKNAKRVSAKVHVDKSMLVQEYYKIPENKKISLLVHLLKQNLFKKSIVFCNTRTMVDSVEYNLKENGINAYKLHGGLEQRKRTHIIEKYTNDKHSCLVSTDVSARGLHIDNLDFIFNFNLPREKTQFVHRIGRTARAGKTGKAISFITTKDKQDFLKICSSNKFEVNLIPLPEFKFLELKKPSKNIKARDTKSSRRRNEFDKRISEVKDQIASARKREEEDDKEYFKNKEKKFKKKQHQDRFKHKQKVKNKKYTRR